jgi:hypothetical protein
MTGSVLVWVFALGSVLLTRAAWAFPTSITTEGIEGIARFLGLLCMIGSFGCSTWMARRLLRQHSLRHYLERDVYRMAA